MSNPFRKVRPGEKIQIPAEAYNTFIDAALDYKRHKREEGGGPFQPPMGAILVKVKNESGSDRQRFDVLAIEEPIITPTDNLTEFQAEPTFRGVTPQVDEAEAPHRSRFAILWEPVPQDQIASRACIAGVTIARVNVVDESHEYADVAHGTCGYLESKPVGGAQILWKEAGTGIRWAVVRLGPVATDICRFRLNEQLFRCGRAVAEKIIFTGDTGWCDPSSTITVVDSLGIVPFSIPAGSMGWARWMPDSQQWEIISWGSGCCTSPSESDSISDSISDSVSDSISDSISEPPSISDSISDSISEPPSISDSTSDSISDSEPPSSSSSPSSESESSSISSESQSQSESSESRPPSESWSGSDKSSASGSLSASASGSPSSGSGTTPSLCAPCLCVWYWDPNTQTWNRAVPCWDQQIGQPCWGCLCDPPPYPGQSPGQTAKTPCYEL